MSNNNKKAQQGVHATMLLVAGGIVMASSQSAAAQEDCTKTGDTYFCEDTQTGDQDLSIPFDYTELADGAYDNLDEKIEQLTPTEAEEEANQEALLTATEFAADANASNDEVLATLTDEDLAAFTAVDMATDDLTAATEARDAAGVIVGDAQTAFDEASDDLTEANGNLADAQAALSGAQSDVDVAQANFDGDQSQANLEALNAALAARADAQGDLEDAEAARTSVLAAANDASDALADAQEAFTEAFDLVTAAGVALVDAQDDLSTSLASNDDFVDAITDAGYTADAPGLANLADATEAADASLATAQAVVDGQDDIANTLVRARDVLVPAAENENAAIAAAAQAYLGDPRADETDADVEVVAALVDHENRITMNETNVATNTADIATNRTDIDLNTANVALNRTDIDTNTVDIAANRTDIDLNTANITLNRTDIDTNMTNITANAEAIVSESETRAAADAAILDQFAAEQNSRIAADTALQNEISSIGARVSGIEGRLSELDDRISSSTATAIALGGMAFMPDMKFNLAVSAGFYGGSQAVAANIGYRVSPSVAITAGIGSGLNGESSVGGRVGFVVGF